MDTCAEESYEEAAANLVSGCALNDSPGEKKALADSAMAGMLVTSKDSEAVEKHPLDTPEFHLWNGLDTPNGHSLVQTKSCDSLMKIETEQLDLILDHLLQTVNHHSMMIKKLPILEETHSILRKDLDELVLGVSSEDMLNEFNSSSTGDNQGRDTGNGQKLDNGGIGGATDIKSSISKICDERKEAIEATLDKANASLPAYDIRDLQREIVIMKTIIGQIQKEHNSGVANSIENSDDIKTLKFRLISLQQQLNSSARQSQVYAMQQSIQRMRSEVEKSNSDVLNEFRVKMDENINHNLSELQAWFKDLDSAVKKRQSDLDARIASCAKECELLALKENTKSDFADVRKCMAHIDDRAEMNFRSIITLRKQHAFMTFQRRHNEWKRRLLLHGWSRWKLAIEKEDEMKEILLKRKQVVRRVLLHHTFKKKRKSFNKWTYFLKWHRKVEKRKETASKVLRRMMQISVALPMAEAFNKWHRHAIIGKMNNSYETKTKERESGSDDTEGMFQNDDAHGGNEYDIMSMMSKFKNDAGGASTFLAQQLHNIRSFDIQWLRQDWERERRKLSDSVDQTLDATMKHFKSRTDDLEKSVNEKIEALAAEFPPIKKQISELTNSFVETRNNLKNVAESHGKRIELLFEKKDSLDEKIVLLEGGSLRASDRISNLVKQKEKLDETIKSLTLKLEESDLRCNENSRNLQSLKEYHEEELHKVHECLGETRLECERLFNELGDTRNELNQYQDVSTNKFDQVQNVFDAMGVRKPKLDVMVSDCSLYERIAKEKNFVVAINSVTDGQDEVDIPADIASFAHDYAEWVAYQADHEALMRVVAGTNPEELVYTDDEIVSRRKSLLDCLKTDLGIAMEARQPEPGALRLEARTRFLCCLIKATDSALSKHDQIIIPTSTRLGRVKASLPICVACDRPLRNKGRKGGISKIDENERKDKAGGADEYDDSKTPSRQPTHTAGGDSSYYVMRSGFKMPINGVAISNADAKGV